MGELIKTSEQYLVEAQEWLQLLPMEIWRKIASYTPIYLDGADIFSILWPELDRKRLWISKSKICQCNIHIGIKSDCHALDHIPRPILTGKRLSKSICSKSSGDKNEQNAVYFKSLNKSSYKACDCSVNAYGSLRTCDNDTKHNCVCNIAYENAAYCKAEKHICVCKPNNTTKQCRSTHHACTCYFVGISAMIRRYGPQYSLDSKGIEKYIIDNQLVMNCRYDGSHPDHEYNLDNDIDYTVVLLHHFHNHGAK